MDALSVNNLVALESVKFVSLEIWLTLYPSNIKEPLSLRLPVNWCVSSDVLPKIVDPDLNIIAEEVNSDSIFCAVTFSPIIAFPGIVKLPVTVKFSPTEKLVVHLSVNKV